MAFEEKYDAMREQKAPAPRKNDPEAAETVLTKTELVAALKEVLPEMAMSFDTPTFLERLSGGRMSQIQSEFETYQALVEDDSTSEPTRQEAKDALRVAIMEVLPQA